MRLARRPATPRACARSASNRTASIASGSTASDVAGRASLDDIGTELAPKLRDGVLERGRRGLRRVLAPEQIDEPIGRDDLPVMDEKRHEERPLALPAEFDGLTVEQHLERSEDPELAHLTSA